jgi:hypothetical protein
MHARRVAVRLVHEQLIGVEKAGTLYEDVWQAEGSKHGTIETLAGLHV